MDKCKTVIKRKHNYTDFAIPRQIGLQIIFIVVQAVVHVETAMYIHIEMYKQYYFYNTPIVLVDLQDSYFAQYACAGAGADAGAS